VLQTIPVTLPLYSDKLSTISGVATVTESMSQINPYLEFTLTQTGPVGEFLVLTHRRSHFIALFSVICKEHGELLKDSINNVFPLYHMSLVDLHYPVESLGCTIISGLLNLILCYRCVFENVFHFISSMYDLD
jgi:hypothetical protein